MSKSLKVSAITIAIMTVLAFVAGVALGQYQDRESPPPAIMYGVISKETAI